MSDSVNQLQSGLHPLERKVLASLKIRPTQWDHDLTRETGLDESRLSMALGWLLTKGVLRVAEEQTSQYIGITDIGRQYARNSLPEERILGDLKAGKKLTVQDLRGQKDVDPLEISTAMGNLKQHGLIRIGQGGILESAGAEIPEGVGRLSRFLKKLDQGHDSIDYWELPVEEKTLLEDFLEKKWKTRGVIRFHEKKAKKLILTELGSSLIQKLTPEAAAGEEVTQLTPDLLKGGAWRGKSFRKFSIGLKPSRVAAGRKHAYRAFLDDVKGKMVSMGFEEMRGPLVESEFWNSDALFMPQFHPARDIHDVYFVDQPKLVRALPEPYATQVGKTHENGWKTGSRGWRYAFDPERAKRLVLRSQGTSVSARMLASKPRIPGKYFSIARCFRYDLVDSTHAPDFFQVEGIALGEKITFRTLLGLLKLFAVEMARASKVKYLPAYFPYTEPSVEMHVHHPKLGWMELGGAGLFRPEVTLPLGVKVPVIAWGLGLDRMAMVALGIQDIRDLFSADLDLIRTKGAGG